MLFVNLINPCVATARRNGDGRGGRQNPVNVERNFARSPRRKGVYRFSGVPLDTCRWRGLMQKTAAPLNLCEVERAVRYRLKPRPRPFRHTPVPFRHTPVPLRHFLRPFHPTVLHFPRARDYSCASPFVSSPALKPDGLPRSRSPSRLCPPLRGRCEPARRSSAEPGSR